MTDLTARQCRMLDLLVIGATSDKELTAALGVSTQTVHRLILATAREIGVVGRPALAAWWLFRSGPRGHREECLCSVCYMRTLA